MEKLFDDTPLTIQPPDAEIIYHKDFLQSIEADI
jgi:hypothetical protein